MKIRERANVFHRIEELRKGIDKVKDDPGGETWLDYLLTTIEYQQREIEALNKRMTDARISANIPLG